MFHVSITTNVTKSDLSGSSLRIHMDYIRLPPSGRTLELEAVQSDEKFAVFQLKSSTYKSQIHFYVIQFKAKSVDLSLMFQ